MQRKTAHRYVVTDDDILSGEPILEGTRTPVRAVVELRRAGVLPEESPTAFRTCPSPRCSMH